MGYVQTGSCPQCGAPIYAEYPWFSVIPPPSKYTCYCSDIKRPGVSTHLTFDTYTDTDGTKKVSRVRSTKVTEDQE